MDTAAFRQELARLQAEYEDGAQDANPGSYRCRSCRLCASCIFCDDCNQCYKCNYCRQCESCTHCGHSVDCRGCHGCAYCIESTACNGSNYLVRCHACADCNYCFGCVGLVRKEFHFLNVPYGREEYFEITRQLAAALRLPRTP